jgi:FdhE protein
MLRFYAEIVRLQSTIYSALESGGNGPPDTSLLLPRFMPLLSLVKKIGPAPLASVADELSRDRAQWEGLLVLNSELDEPTKFFARALLQPFTEYLASKSDLALGAGQRVCPFCGEKPQVGVLRGEGDGAKRSLICSLCSTEWSFRRILCPNCGEESQRSLPVYAAEEFPHVRVEACDSCHTYIKSVDLTRNGLAVPVVDELATVSLNLWAEEHGYTKVQLNLLGM